MKLAAFGIIALVPLMLGIGPTASRSGRDLVSPLCGGGLIVIHLGSGAPTPAPPCPIKGCHASCTRRFLDAAQ